MIFKKKGEEYNCMKITNSPKHLCQRSQAKTKNKKIKITQKITFDSFPIIIAVSAS